MTGRTLCTPAGEVLARKRGADFLLLRSRTIRLQLPGQPPGMTRHGLRLGRAPTETGFLHDGVNGEGVAPRTRTRDRLGR